jgi:hypothetical protein
MLRVGIVELLAVVVRGSGKTGGNGSAEKSGSDLSNLYSLKARFLSK